MGITFCPVESIGGVQIVEFGKGEHDVGDAAKRGHT